MSQPAPKPVTTSSGLQIIDTKVGTGASPRPNQTAVVHYTGWLYDERRQGQEIRLHRSIAASRSSFRSARAA